MATKTEIADLALSHIGQTKQIQNIDTDKGLAVRLIRQFYDISRDTTMRDFPWPFAGKQVELALVAERPTAPAHPHFQFAYRYPPDCLSIRAILSSLRRDNRQSMITQKVGRDSEGLLIFTDQKDACLDYTFRDLETIRYTPDFIMALSYRLAAYIAPGLTEGDQNKLGEKSLQLYFHEISGAQANSRNEEQDDQDPRSEYERYRDGDFQPSNDTRQPFGIP